MNPRQGRPIGDDDMFEAHSEEEYQIDDSEDEYSGEEVEVEDEFGDEDEDEWDEEYEDDEIGDDVKGIPLRRRRDDLRRLSARAARRSG